MNERPVHYIEFHSDDPKTVVAREYYDLGSDRWELAFSSATTASATTPTIRS